MPDITQLSAVEMSAKIRSGELGAVEVLDAHLHNIESANASINAIVTLCAERALKEAQQADAIRVRGEALPILFGLPYVVKDTLPTKEVKTTFGSLLFEGYIPDYDAIHVERARAAGAIVVGKSNTPEFASGAQTDNPVFGITRNPHDESKTVTGSSGGAAAALAAYMVPMADGSDLGGSLRSPASACGVVGFRPTAGQVPKLADAVPFDRLHVFGPMARSVEDIALFMSVFAGADQRCPLAAIAEPIDYSEALNTNHDNVRIAFSAHPCGVNTHPEVVTAITSCIDSFITVGASVDEACPDIGENHAAHQVMVALNAITELAPFLKDERFGRSPRLRMFLEKGASLTVADIAQARRTQARCWHVIGEFFQRYNFLVWPTMSGLPFDVTLSEDEIDEDWRPLELTPSLNLPSVSLPAGLSSTGLPIGLQIIGPPNSDFQLMQLAYAFQQARSE